jgi:hypothetical protein
MQIVLGQPLVRGGGVPAVLVVLEVRRRPPIQEAVADIYERVVLNLVRCLQIAEEPFRGQHRVLAKTHGLFEDHNAHVVRQRVGVVVGVGVGRAEEAGWVLPEVVGHLDLEVGIGRGGSVCAMCRGEDDVGEMRVPEHRCRYWPWSS